MARAIVSVTNDLYTDQRVHKVCIFLMEQGYDVLLVGRKLPSSLKLEGRPYKTKRLRLLFKSGPLFYGFYTLRLFLFLLFKRCSVLVSNDLDTLLANYLAKKMKPKTRLVYDSHEYFTEVPELIKRPRVQKIWLYIERKIFPKLESIYTVNESIAKIYGDLYTKDVKVVRNISPLWRPQGLLNKDALGIPELKPLIVLQGAGINIERGAEEAVEAMQHVAAVLMIVGDGDVIAQLKDRVQSLHLEDKVFFYGKKPYNVMMNYTHYADIGLTLDKPVSLNYKLSLPNKVFDYMHTSTAIVATNILEVANVVNKHHIGEIIENFSAITLAATLNSLLADPHRLEQYKSNCWIAAQIENWENETSVLKTIYPSIDQ